MLLKILSKIILRNFTVKITNLVLSFWIFTRLSDLTNSSKNKAFCGYGRYVRNRINIKLQQEKFWILASQDSNVIFLCLKRSQKSIHNFNWSPISIVDLRQFFPVLNICYFYVMPTAFSKAKEKWGKGAGWMKDSQVTG